MCIVVVVVYLYCIACILCVLLSDCLFRPVYSVLSKRYVHVFDQTVYMQNAREYHSVNMHGDTHSVECRRDDESSDDEEDDESETNRMMGDLKLSL